MFVRQHTPSSRVARVFAFSPFDILCAAAAPIAAILLRDADRLLEGSWFGADATYCVLSFFVTLVVFAAFRISDPLSRYFSMEDVYRVVWAAAASVALSGILMFLVTRLESASRSAFLLHFLLLTAALVFGRLVARSRDIRKRKSIRSSRSSEPNVQNTLVIGVHPATAPLLRFLEDFPNSPVRIVALLDSRAKHAGRTVFGYRVAGSPAALNDILDEYTVHGIEIHRLVVAGPEHGLDSTTRAAIATVRREQNIAVSFAGDLLAYPAAAQSLVGQTGAATLRDAADDALARVGEQPVDGSPSGDDIDPAVGAFRTTGGYWRIKRVLDVVIASMLLVTVLPVMALVGLLVAVEMGIPVIFWQQRVGRNRRRVMVYKFRTLRSPYRRNGGRREDVERLGVVGSWLRRTRLDELPQLYNVIIGDMSLIGPRPLLPVDLPQSDDTRLLVRPGLTGWAQVNGGKLLGVGDKNLLDKWYIAHVSAWVDFKIALRTISMISLGEKSNEAAISQARIWANPISSHDDNGAPYDEVPSDNDSRHSNVVALSRERDGTGAGAGKLAGVDIPTEKREHLPVSSDPVPPGGSWRQA